MSSLLTELVGEELALELEGYDITKFKVFREKKQILLGIKCPALPPKELFDRLKGKIAERFGISNIMLEPEYDKLELNEDTQEEIFENLKPYIIEKIPSSMSLLLHSVASLKDGVFCVHLKYGGALALENRQVDAVIAEMLEEIYGIKTAVKFIEDKTDAKEIYKKVKEEKESLIKDTSDIAAVAEAKAQKPKKVALPEKTGEDGEDDGVVTGKAFTGEITPIADINEYSGKVIVQGRLVGFEDREIKNNKTILEMFVTDSTGSISCKLFLDTADFKEIKGTLKKLSAVCVRGTAQYDSYAKEVVVMARDIMKSEIKLRPDDAEVKRVELHAHTSMSALDARAFRTSAYKSFISGR
jgi:DNA polymerase-3 subunit alpha (Gram-positive type)